MQWSYLYANSYPNKFFLVVAQQANLQVSNTQVFL